MAWKHSHVVAAVLSRAQLWQIQRFVLIWTLYHYTLGFSELSYFHILTNYCRSFDYNMQEFSVRKQWGKPIMIKSDHIHRLNVLCVHCTVQTTFIEWMYCVYSTDLDGDIIVFWNDIFLHREDPIKTSTCQKGQNKKGCQVLYKSLNQYIVQYTLCMLYI